MLEHVSKALPVELLIFGADVVPQLDGDDGTGEILECYDIQAVVKLYMAVIKLHLSSFGASPTSCRGREYHQHQKCKDACEFPEFILAVHFDTPIVIIGFCFL